MLIVGLNFAHDSGVCIVEDGRVLGLFQRERFARVKRKSFLTGEFLRFCLTRAGVDWRDVDHVAVTSSQAWPLIFIDPDDLRVEHDISAFDSLGPPEISRDLMERTVGLVISRRELAAHRYRQMQEPGNRYTEYFGSERLKATGEVGSAPSFDWPLVPEWWGGAPSTDRLTNVCATLKRDRDHPRFAYTPIRVSLGGVKKTGLMVPHHMSHAASAYYTSDRDSAALYTLDNGVGYLRANGYSGGIYAFGQGNRLAPLAPHYDYHGQFYQRVGEYLDLGLGGAAGKLMGLAPYGEARFFDPCMIGNAYDVFDENYAHGRDASASKSLKHFLNAMKRAAVGDYNALPRRTQHHVADAYGARDVVRPNIDCAMTAQRVFTDNALRAIAVLKESLSLSDLDTSTLALAGGGALNCPANSTIWATGMFADIYIPPYCDDSGLALGAALALAHDVLDEPRQPMMAQAGASAYLGLAYDSADVNAARALHGEAVVETSVADGCRAAAEDIAAGRIIAWFEGRSEVGPRALGHRSILSDPRDAAKWRDVNRVKQREYWRPFAPAVLAEKAGDWFEGAPASSPHMLFNAQVRGTDLPAITHVDGSARIQTVDASCGGFRRVLEGFDALTGVPVIMNTSFNGPGEPIVETPDEALAFLVSSEVDAVYVEGRRFSRPDGGMHED